MNSPWPATSAGAIGLAGDAGVAAEQGGNLRDAFLRFSEQTQ